MNNLRLLLLCAAALATGCGDPAPAPGPAPDPGTNAVQLVFGIYTTDKPSEVVKETRPALDALEQAATDALGKPVKVKMNVATSYEVGLQNLLDRKVDFAKFGPATYVLARRAQPGLHLLAMESSKGEKTFNGVIAVHADSDIKAIRQLAGKRFAFGNAQSTIGRYLSQLHLHENGIDATNLASFVYLDRHDLVGSEVGAGNYDAGALKESTFKKQVAAGVPLRALDTFPNVTKPWVAHEGLDPELVAALRTALLGLDDPKALAALGKDGFLPSEDADYERIRESMDDNPLFHGNPLPTP